MDVDRVSVLDEHGCRSSFDVDRVSMRVEPGCSSSMSITLDERASQDVSLGADGLYTLRLLFGSSILLHSNPSKNVKHKHHLVGFQPDAITMASGKKSDI
jgi:hypothetical protein